MRPVAEVLLKPEPQGPVMPDIQSLRRSSAWGTVSNAFLKSKYAMSLEIPASSDVYTSEYEVNSWVKHERLRRKPN